MYSLLHFDNRSRTLTFSPSSTPWLPPFPPASTLSENLAHTSCVFNPPLYLIITVITTRWELREVIIETGWWCQCFFFVYAINVYCILFVDLQHFYLLCRSLIYWAKFLFKKIIITILLFTPSLAFLDIYALPNIR